MAEVNTAEKEAKAEAAFGGAFNGTPPEVIPPAKVAEEPAVVPAKPETVAPVVVPEKPQYIRVTKQEWDNTKASLGKVSTLESQVAKLTGSIPKADQLIQQVMDRVQAQTPAGSPIKLTKEDLAELSEDFPDVSEKLLTGLGRAFERANVKGTGAAVDPDAINKAVDARLKARDDAAAAAVAEKEMKGLTETYPDWGRIVGQPVAMGTETPVETPWRKWATTNDPAALVSDSAAEVKASIDKFMASQKPADTPPKPTKADARRAIIEDAITPRADGSAPPLNQPQSAEDAFGQAFASAKRH